MNPAVALLLLARVALGGPALPGRLEMACRILQEEMAENRSGWSACAGDSAEWMVAELALWSEWSGGREEIHKEPLLVRSGARLEVLAHPGALADSSGPIGVWCDGIMYWRDADGGFAGLTIRRAREASDARRRELVRELQPLLPEEMR